MKLSAATYVQNGNIVFVTRVTITEDIYNAANRDQAELEFVCGPCQHDLQPRYDTEFIVEDLP